MLLPVAEVRSIVVKDMKTTIAKTLTTSKKTKRLSLKFDKPEKKQAVSIMYFRPGFRWIPTYRVSLNENKEKKTATVSLQAELLNEAEDLDNVPLDIVVGVPNFRFRGTPSPLVLEATLRNALAEAAPDLMGNPSNSMSNAMYSQRAGDFRQEQAQANGVAEARHRQFAPRAHRRRRPGFVRLQPAQDHDRQRGPRGRADLHHRRALSRHLYLGRADDEAG